MRRYELIRRLTRYEDALAKSLKLAIAASDGEIRLDSPLFELVKLNKARVSQIREELRSANEC